MIPPPLALHPHLDLAGFRVSLNSDRALVLLPLLATCLHQAAARFGLWSKPPILERVELVRAASDGAVPTGARFGLGLARRLCSPAGFVRSRCSTAPGGFRV